MLKINNVVIVNHIFDIEKCFRQMCATVNDTYELNNVVITYEKYPRPAKKLPSKTDEDERKWILEEINTTINKIKKDRYTRKAILYNLHKSDLAHNCLSLFHLYYREHKLHLNVYVRSMNFAENFEHDMYTFDLILNKACKKLELETGQIVVFIMSLHKFRVLSAYEKRGKNKNNN